MVADKTLNLDLRLEVASRGEEIDVSASRSFGEAEAINQTRTADNLIDVLPANVITSLPNANVADALGTPAGGCAWSVSKAKACMLIFAAWNRA